MQYHTFLCRCVAALMCMHILLPLTKISINQTLKQTMKEINNTFKNTINDIKREDQQNNIIVIRMDTYTLSYHFCKHCIDQL